MSILPLKTSEACLWRTKGSVQWAAARLLISIFLVSGARTPGGESAVQAWVQRYSHPADSDDRAQKVVTDNAGNVIVAGYTDEAVVGADFLIIKYSGAGMPLWTNRYNGPGNGDDLASAVAVDGTGKVFVTGSSYGSNGLSAYATVAYSAPGVPLWTNRYGGSSNSLATAIATDGGGNVLVTGNSSDRGGFPDYVTIKYSETGVPLWTNRYDGPGNFEDRAIAVAVDSSGNVFVTGYSYDTNNFSEYATVAYSGVGVPLWTNRHAGYAAAVAVDGDDNVIVTGVSYDNVSFWDYATIKYSGAGVPLWTNRYDGPNHYTDYPAALAVDGDQNVFVTGWSDDGDYDYATVAYSGAGMPLWTNRYGDPWNHEARATAITVNGGGAVFVTGYLENSSDYHHDYATVAYSASGLPLWTNRYTGPWNYEDTANAIAVDGAGNVFVTGQSVGSSGSSDGVTIKYSEVGLPLWTNRYNGTGKGNNSVIAVKVDGGGNVIVAGNSYDGDNKSDYTIIRYSAAGVPLWTNHYNGLGNGHLPARAMVVDGSRNVCVTGSDGASSISDYVTIKYSEGGVPLWTNRYDGPLRSVDFPTAVAVDAADNVFVTGSTTGSAGDYGTIKYSAAGVPLWTNRYDGPASYTDTPAALAVDRDGNVLVTGESHGRGTSLDFATVKYSAAGIPLWTNRYNAPANREDRAIAVAVDRSGNVFVTGYSARSLGGSLYDCATIKYSAAGVPLWTNVQPGYVTALALDDSGSVFVSTASATVKYSGTGVTLWTNRYPGYAAALSVDGSGNVFVTGDSYNTNNDYDYVMVKYTGDGVPLWTNSYNGPAKGNDWARAVAIGPDGAIYVTGESDGDYSSGTGYDFATIKYVPVPVVAIERSAANVLVSWPSAFSDFVLEQNTGSLSPANWSTVTDPIQNDGTNRTLVVNPPSGDRFYRLFKR